jgi:hypothetical protein
MVTFLTLPAAAMHRPGGRANCFGFGLSLQVNDDYEAILILGFFLERFHESELIF